LGDPAVDVDAFEDVEIGLLESMDRHIDVIARSNEKAYRYSMLTGLFSRTSSK